QKPQQLFSRDPGEGQASRTQKRRPQKRAALRTQMEPAAAAARGAEQASQRAREFKVLSHPGHSGRISVFLCVLFTCCLSPSRPLAFQDVFKLFSSSPAGTVDMHSMKAALCNAGVQLSPQEMCEALGQADLDGDGSVSFEDFLGVLTDSHRLAQCLGEGNSRVCDPHGLQTLFLETLFKLMSLGFVPYKSAQEVMSYYSRKQRSLRLNCSWKGGPRCRGSTGRSHAGLAFFCQATRLSGLSNAELARTLQGLHKEGARSPYSQVPTLNGRMQPECYTQNRTSRPEVRLPKSYWRSPPKRQVDREVKVKSQVQRAGAGLEDKGGPSGSLPPTLVQRQPCSPPPACLQRPAMKNSYKQSVC
uniref:EF-hand domain-containing protein n=1 Tax=Sus scrofa TaxID=9823 RepID=A0A4X1TBG8_PIG